MPCSTTIFTHVSSSTTRNQVACLKWPDAARIAWSCRFCAHHQLGDASLGFHHKFLLNADVQLRQGSVSASTDAMKACPRAHVSRCAFQNSGRFCVPMLTITSHTGPDFLTCSIACPDLSTSDFRQATRSRFFSRLTCLGDVRVINIIEKFERRDHRDFFFKVSVISYPPDAHARC